MESIARKIRAIEAGAAGTSRSMNVVRQARSATGEWAASRFLVPMKTAMRSAMQTMFVLAAMTASTATETGDPMAVIAVPRTRLLKTRTGTESATATMFARPETTASMAIVTERRTPVTAAQRIPLRTA